MKIRRGQMVPALMVAAFLATPPVVAAEWQAEVGGGILLYTPRIVNIPRGSSETARDLLGEVSIARALSPSVTLRLSGGMARGDESRWESRGTTGGSAEIPTPDVWSLFLSAEAPLLRRSIEPFAGVGGGVMGFGEVSGTIRFAWEGYDEESEIDIPARTDPAMLFDLGVRIPVHTAVRAVVRYRLVSVFSGDQVDTLDRITLGARLPF